MLIGAKQVKIRVKMCQMKMVTPVDTVEAIVEGYGAHIMVYGYWTSTAGQ